MTPLSLREGLLASTPTPSSNRSSFRLLRLPTRSVASDTSIAATSDTVAPESRLAILRRSSEAAGERTAFDLRVGLVEGFWRSRDAMGSREKAMEESRKPAPEADKEDAGKEATEKRSFFRLPILAVAAGLICFGAVLLADGLADIENRAPHSEKRYRDGKELAIAAGFLLGGGLAVALSCATLRPRRRRSSALCRVGLALTGGLVLSVVLRGVDLRLGKPHWFTTNVPVKLHLATGGYQDSEIRARVLVERINDMARGYP